MLLVTERQSHPRSLLPQLSLAQNRLQTIRRPCARVRHNPTQAPVAFIQTGITAHPPIEARPTLGAFSPIKAHPPKRVTKAERYPILVPLPSRQPQATSLSTLPQRRAVVRSLPVGMWEILDHMAHLPTQSSRRMPRLMRIPVPQRRSFRAQRACSTIIYPQCPTTCLGKQMACTKALIFSQDP